MIVNTTKNTIIADEFTIEKGFGKIRGLIGSEKRALVLKTRFGIHTFFLKNPIDLIVLDRNSKAVIVKRSLKANRVFFWNIKYDFVIELPKSTIQSSKTEKGDILQLVS